MPCKYLLILLLIANPIFAFFTATGELGVRQYDSSVDRKDKLDAVWHAEVGYVTKNLFSADLGFTTGSVKRVYRIYSTDEGTEFDFAPDSTFSHSIDLLLGKVFGFKHFFIYGKAGANFSTIKIHNTIRGLHPRYYIEPTVKLGFGIPLGRTNSITFNYQYVFSTSGEVKVTDSFPYRLKGFPSNSMITIGIQHAFV